MQIRQRQTRLKHASETDDKLCFSKYSVFQGILTAFIMRNKSPMESHVTACNIFHSLLFSEIEGFSCVFLGFVLLFKILFSSLNHKIDTPTFNSKSPFASTPLNS